MIFHRIPLTPAEQDVLRVARSLIRDMGHGWLRRELQEPPERVCEKLSQMLGEKYDYAEGAVIK